jgi:hypothetical protein
MRWLLAYSCLLMKAPENIWRVTLPVEIPDIVGDRCDSYFPTISSSSYYSEVIIGVRLSHLSRTFPFESDQVGHGLAIMCPAFTCLGI